MISVIVPIYNAEKYLDKCLSSIANQTYKDLEVILVNDGSTDGSRLICERFCDKYKNFILIDKRNGGQMSAWILAVNKAKGEFLGFVDSDDFIDPTMFEKMICKQKEHNCDLVMCGRKIFSDKTIKNIDDSSLIKKDYYSESEMNYVRKAFLPTLTGNLSQARWGKLFKKDIYRKCMERYCKQTVRTFEDRFIVIPYVFYSKSFSYLDEPLYYWRQVSLSSSRKPRPELNEIADLLYNSHISMLKDLCIYDLYSSAIEIEKIDILRNIFERNVCVKGPILRIRKESKKILSLENRNIVKKHRKDCVGRFGKFFYFCNRLNSPLILTIAGKIHYFKTR